MTMSIRVYLENGLQHTVIYVSKLDHIIVFADQG